MGSTSLRLSSMLTFDEEKEADIIRFITELNSCHKTGEFLSNLIRVAVENPEIIDFKGGKYAPGTTLKVIESVGQSPTRMSHMQSIAREVQEVKNRVDGVYELCMQMYTLALMGKKLGLEDKTRNSMKAVFLLEKQVNDLRSKYKIDISDGAFNSAKLENIEKRAEQCLEYIVNSYSGVVSELVSDTKQQSNITYIEKRAENEVILNGNSNAIEISNEVADKKVNIMSNDLLIVEDEKEEAIDFDFANMDVMAKFLGQS